MAILQILAFSENAVEGDTFVCLKCKNDLLAASFMLSGDMCGWDLSTKQVYSCFRFSFLKIVADDLHFIFCSWSTIS